MMIIITQIRLKIYQRPSSFVLNIENENLNNLRKNASKHIPWANFLNIMNRYEDITIQMSPFKLNQI